MRTLLFALITLFYTINGQAATYIIHNGGDTGQFTLRYYIEVSSPFDSIQLSSDIAGITLTEGELLIQHPLSIIGQNGIQFIERNSISTTPAFRVFHFINSGEVLLKNLEIRYGLSPLNSYTPQPGGGLFIEDSNCYLRVENCRINSNKAMSGGLLHTYLYDDLPQGGYGGGVCNFGNLNIINSEINNNSAGDGGLIFFVKQTEAPTFACLAFKGGNGGGIANFHNLSLSNCKLINNKAGNGGYFLEVFTLQYCCESGGSGGAIYNNTSAGISLINCLITNNHPGNATSCPVGNGAAIFNSGYINLSNSTVSHQYFPQDVANKTNIDSTERGTNASILITVNSPTIITNCILYNDPTDNPDVVSYDLYTGDTTSTQISYSLIGKKNWDNPQGNNNLFNVDPGFDGTNSYELAFNSPCINSGNPDFTWLPPTDLAGQPRIVEGIVDMGAFEFQGLTNTNYTRSNYLTVYPNPFTSSLTIKLLNQYPGEPLNLKLFDITGRSIFQHTILSSNVENYIGIPISLPPGTYVLRIESQMEVFNKRIIKL